MPQTSYKSGRALAPSTIKKYEQALKRIEDAEKELDKPAEVIAWIKTKEGTAQKVYYSAIKYHLSQSPRVFPEEYQEELNRLYKLQNEKDGNQQLSEKQQTNFVPFADLLAVQERLAAKKDKTDAEFKDYLIASLYTLQPPVRADYGQIQVFKKRSLSRTGNELIWGQKKDPYFVFRVYKTAKTYGYREIRVAPALVKVITEWFGHLGNTPKYLLGRAVEPADLLPLITHAFRSTKRDIGVNLLRHAYITEFLKTPRTIAEREELAMKMLHDKDTQEKYAVASELKKTENDA